MTEDKHFPLYINCAFCPAQALANRTTYKLEGWPVCVRKYECPASHITFVGETE